MRTLVMLLCVPGALFSAPQEAPESYAPPQFVSGNAPPQPPRASAGGLTILELHVAPSGIVTEAVVLDEAEPFTQAIQETSRLWRFRPAEEDGAAVASKVLIVGVFRPPVLMGAQLPEPTSVTEPSADVPYPTATATPNYPPNALYEGVGFVELEIDETGAVTEAKLLSGENAFDEVALEAARAFRFRPAKRDRQPVASRALVLFGFRQPVTLPRVPR